MIAKPSFAPRNSVEGRAPGFFEPLVIGHYFASVLVIGAVCLLVYGLAWNFSTRRYLKGFADAIVPLDGSPQEKTNALLAWLRHEPRRRDARDETGLLRDPVWILQNAQLLESLRVGK